MSKDYSQYFKPSLKDARKRQSISQIITDQFKLNSQLEAMGSGKSFHIRTYGCQANERDSETIEGILKALGYKQAQDADNADVIILNTCAIRENAEEKVFGRIGYFKGLKQTNPDLIIGFCGCMAQEETVVDRILKKHPHVDLIFGTHNIHRLPQLLQEASFSKERIVEVWSKEGDVIENLPSVRASHIKAWVNIMYGCDKFCTYCIVPYTRGKERSRRPIDILAEVKELQAKGYQEITLLGQNVNAYGRDLDDDLDFATLLDAVAKIGIPRVRFTTSHPWNFTDEMVRVIAENKNIMPYIHLPVQSGNDQVLKLMGRKYTINEYKHIFDSLKAAIPNCSFSTDIIVGFPNETESQFLETLEIVEYCEYDNAYTFVYSPRVGTPAARMVDNVSKEEKDERLQRLNVVVNKHMRAKNERFLNQIVEVLVEGPSKKDPDILSGYTPQQKLVNFKGNPNQIGRIIKVKITEARTWSLFGEAIDEQH